jgi:hypothetical protein
MLVVAPLLLGQPVQIRTQELPWAIVGSFYQARIETGADGRCPANIGIWVAAGKLPRGLEVRGENLTGAAREMGDFKFVIRAANTCSATEKEFDLVVTGQPILHVSPAALSFERHVGQVSGPAVQSVQVSATWPDLPYAVKADAAWLVAKKLGGVTPAEGSALSSDLVAIEVAVKDLAPGIYRSAIHFSTFVGANAPEVVVTLTVLP